jgi:Flp pilus assembly pilin Flp
MLGRIWRSWADEEGLTTPEYALLLAIVVVAALSAWEGFDPSRGGGAAAATSVVETTR